jgi:hypothetical protein
MKRFQKPVLFLFVLALLHSCKNNSDFEKWDWVTTDSKIDENKIYKELNKQKEIFFMLEKRDSSKRSSDVYYFAGENLNFKDQYSKNYNCEAYFPLSDTLIINIGQNSLFRGKGFKINLIDNKFHIQTYETSDLIDEFEVLPTYKIIYQKLILDKANYKIGDSLFGKVEFKSIETDQDNNQIQHFGKGYFRTKVKEL